MGQAVRIQPRLIRARRDSRVLVGGAVPAPIAGDDHAEGHRPRADSGSERQPSGLR